MRRYRLLALAVLALAACNQNPQQAPTNQTGIKVRSNEQEQLHQLDAMNLAIGRKRAIYDAGYTCKSVIGGGFVGTYENLDMWMAQCTYWEGRTRNWAVFAGPDGSAQVRDCKDVKATGLPECVVKQKPKGSFNAMK
jgi:hypothetical protein